MTRSTRTTLIFCVFLGLSAFAVFLGVLGNDFVNYDDFQYVTENRHVTSGISLENVVWAFTSGYAANWHPLTWISHMVDVELFGMDPWGHHLVNIILHAANTCLLFLFLRGVSTAGWRSAIVAALFAVHPLHVESVAWIAERKDVLSTFFGMLTLLAYARYARNPDKFHYALICVGFILCLMSKPMLVTLPFLMLLLDYWPLRRFEFVPAESCGVATFTGNQLPIAKLLIEKIPLFVLSALSSCVTFYVQSKGEAVHSLDSTPLPLRVSNALVSYVRYLGKTFWPRDLAVMYPLPKSIPLVQTTGCVLLLLLISYVAFASAKRRPYLFIGWLWFLGTLVPVIGLVQVGLQAMADRYSYFPLIGIFVMIVWAFSDLGAERPSWRVPLASAAGLLLLVFSIATWKYERYWKDTITLFTHAIASTPVNYQAHAMLGKGFYDAGRIDEALHQYLIAQQLNPRAADVYVDMGIAYAKQGNPDEAIKSFTTALMLKPGSKYVHYNLAVAFQRKGEYEESAAHYYEVLLLDPFSIESRYNLGVALMCLRRFDEASRHFVEVLRMKPELEDARQNLQTCLRQKGN